MGEILKYFAFWVLIGFTTYVVPAAVNAQDYISATVSAVVRAQQEEACRKGAPATPKTIAWATSTSNTSLDAYMALTVQSDEKAFRKVFAMKEKDVSWKDADGALPVMQIGPKLAMSKPVLTPIAFVVAGDGMSARGVWKASWKTTSDTYYAIDFSGTPKMILGGNPFRVWHMTIFNGETPPSLPVAYCHYSTVNPW